MRVQLSEASREHVSHLRTLLTRHLAEHGYKPRECGTAWGKPDHWRIWCLDSLIDALSMLLEGEPSRYVLRTMLLAREYRGRIGGYWPSPTASDASDYIERELILRLDAFEADGAARSAPTNA